MMYLIAHDSKSHSWHVLLRLQSAKINLSPCSAKTQCLPSTSLAIWRKLHLTLRITLKPQQSPNKSARNRSKRWKFPSVSSKTLNFAGSIQPMHDTCTLDASTLAKRQIRRLGRRFFARKLNSLVSYVGLCTHA